MQEYYIRKEGDEDSRGPFTVEQLASLVEAGQVDRQTFYYDAVAEKWVEIQSNPDLSKTLFPIKKKLTMKSKESTLQTLNITATPEEKPITVEDMLAAAEGKTEETRGKRDFTVDEERAALLGLRLMSLLLAISAAGLLVPHMELIMAAEFWPIATNPLVVLGVIDVFLALLLFLEVTAFYFLVRLRAAVAAGFFAFYFGSIAEWLPLAAAIAGAVALYALTTRRTLASVISFSLLGLAGMGGFTYLMLY